MYLQQLKGILRYKLARGRKGVSFVNGRYTKGIPFLSKMVYKRVKGLELGGGAFPDKTLLSTLSPGPSPPKIRDIQSMGFKAKIHC